MREDRDNCRPIIVAAHHIRPCLVWDGAMTKSFAVFLLVLVIPWVPKCFVEVVAGKWAAVTQISNNIIERRGCTTTALKGYKKTPLDAPYRLKNSRHVFCTGVGDAGCKPVRKASIFLVTFGGGRPARRIKGCSARNIYQLNNTTTRSCFGLYLVEIYR